MYRKIKDMIWPAPSSKMSELEWRLRHATIYPISKSDRMHAAAIIGAYRQMVSDTQKKRNMIVKELIKGPNI